MTDVVDVATFEIEKQLEQTIASCSNKKIVSPTGYCFNCDDKLTTAGIRFCDTDCRDDYDQRMKRRA